MLKHLALIEIVQLMYYFFIKWSKQEIKNTNTNTKQGKCCMENRPATATDLSS